MPRTRPRLAVCALAPLLALAAPRLHAQQLAAGTWTGTITPPSGRTLPVTYEVARAGDSVTATMSAPMGVFPFRALRLEGEHLRFAWTIEATELSCDLVTQPNRGYAGTCTDDQGVPGQMVMVPPAGSVAPAAPAADTAKAAAKPAGKGR